MEKLRLELQELGGAQDEARRALQRELGEQITALSDEEAEARSLLQDGLQQQIERMGGAQDEARRRDMKSLNDQISGLNTDLTLLKQTEINDLQSKWNKQQEEINDQNAKYRDLQGKWNKQQGEINDQNSKYQNLQNELNTQQGKINDQNRDFRDLQTVINDKQTGINALNTRFQKEQKKVNDLNDEFRAEQQKLNRVQTQASDANSAALHAQDLVIQGIPRMIHVDEGRASMWSGSEGTLNYGGGLANFYLSSNIGGSAINFEARGRWTGAVWVMAVTTGGDTDVKAAIITSSDRYFNMKPNGLGVRYKAATAWIFPDVKK